jgi:outer membrane protein assembly factor BamB
VNSFRLAGPARGSADRVDARRYRRLQVALVGVLALSACNGSTSAISAHPSPSRQPVPSPTLTISPSPGPVLITGDPSALPGTLLITDRGNSRLIEVDGRGNIVWQFPPPGYTAPIPFDRPDDAFYSPDGRSISTNEEFEQTVQVIDRASGQLIASYGKPYQSGSSPSLLNGPDDAYLLPDGRLLTADIHNCRIMIFSQGSQSQIGHTGICRHDPANGYLASPNGDLPDRAYRNLVVTEISGSWVDVLSLPDLTYQYSIKSPAHYPSDATLQPDGTILLSDYVAAGAVYRISRDGQVVWSYKANLDHPSIAISLPNGYVAIADDYGARVIIVDPATNQVLWQYGVKNQPGRTADHLNVPDGIDFRPAIAPSPGTGPTR